MLSLIVFALVAPSTTKLGLALNVPEGGSGDAFVAAMRQQIRLGLDGGVISLKWDEYEALAGKPLDDGLSGAAFMGQKALLTISTLDTVRKRLPSDVQDEAFGSEKLQKRFDAFLAEIAPKLKSKVEWISLGNEVNVYLGEHPDELSGYVKFLRHSRDVLHALLPSCKVGVTVTCSDAMQNPQLVDALNDQMDLSIFTYYPLKGFQVLPPEQVAAHFGFMRAAAHDRPLLLQEIGYPSSNLNGSSPEKQEQFVKSVFKEIDRCGDTLRLADFFIQSDFSPPALKVLNGYYGVDQPQFSSFLASLGLCDSSGKPKLAWAEFCKECLKRKPVLETESIKG